VLSGLDHIERGAELVYMQQRLLDLQTEQTHLLSAILEAVSEPRT